MRWTASKIFFLASGLAVLTVAVLGVSGRLPNLNPQPSGQGVEEIFLQNQPLRAYVLIKKAVITNKAGGFVVVAKLKADLTVEGNVAFSQYLAPGTYENVGISYIPGEFSKIILKKGDRLSGFIYIDNGDKTYDSKDKSATIPPAVITLE